MGQHMSSLIETMRTNPVHINVKEKKEPEQKEPEQKEPDESIITKFFTND
jgi:hypothetical protein